MECIGYQYLIESFGLKVCELLVKSYLTGESQRKSVVNDDYLTNFYPKSRISISDTWESNLLFAIRNEGVNLEVLKAFFTKLDVNQMEKFVGQHPTGMRHRRIWMLYERLTDKRLDFPDVQAGNYVDLIDGEIQLALPEISAKRERRYRVNNNLIGNFQFSPLVRLVEKVKETSGEKLKAESDRLLGNYPSELIYRAVQYMFVKETRSSFAIERETPTQRRMDSFLTVLRDVTEAPLTERLLVSIQNKIVDERYAQDAWRTDQVYVGETMTPGHEKVHCIGVRPKDLGAIMDAYLSMVNGRLEKKDLDSVLMAAIASFAFVFIHPFDDGNGRIHRYLMHLVLSRLGFTPRNFIFPISAVMLKNTGEYDRMLESFSRRLMKAIDYEIDANGEVEVLDESVDFYRYIDYTPIVERFLRVMSDTITTEWKVELDYLKAYDNMRKGMREIVDMPDKKANQFIMFVRDNNGRLSKNKRGHFDELNDEEVSALENVIVKALAGITNT